MSQANPLSIEEITRKCQGIVDDAKVEFEEGDAVVHVRLFREDYDDAMLTATVAKGMNTEYPIQLAPGTVPYLFSFTYDDDILKVEEEIKLNENLKLTTSVDIFKACMVRALQELRAFLPNSGHTNVTLVNQRMGYCADDADNCENWRKCVGFKETPHAFGPHENRPRCPVTDYVMKLI